MHLRRATALAFLVAVVGCGGSTHTSGIPAGGSTPSSPSTSTTTASPSTGCKTVSRPPAKNVKLRAPKTRLDPHRRYLATVVTNCGTFAFALDVRDAPHTTASIAYLAGKRFFDRTIFHRIVPGFVIQGGDPTGSGQGGPGYSTVDKPPSSTKYTTGVVAMAKTGTDPAGTSGSQFFVVTGADAGLPPDYAVVGKVVRGMNVVQRIGKLGDQSEQPTAVVEILRFRVSSR